MSETVRHDAYVALRACRLWRAASDDAVSELARRATVLDVPRVLKLTA